LIEHDWAAEMLGQALPEAFVKRIAKDVKEAIANYGKRYA